MKIQRLLLIFLLLPLCAAAQSRGMSAVKALDKCAAKINAAPSLTAKFTLAAGTGRYACDMTLSKQRFHLKMPQMEVWFDGTTQWAYGVKSQELSVSEPTADELLESNPFAILNHYSKAYNCRMLQSEGGKTVVELVPKAAAVSSLRKAVVAIDPKTWLPSKITVTLSNGRTFTATVGSISQGKQLPQSRFTFDKKLKVAETIDLR